jgi:hypothetical protein
MEWDGSMQLERWLMVVSLCRRGGEYPRRKVSSSSGHSQKLPAIIKSKRNKTKQTKIK